MQTPPISNYPRQNHAVGSRLTLDQARLAVQQLKLLATIFVVFHVLSGIGVLAFDLLSLDDFSKVVLGGFTAIFSIGMIIVNGIWGAKTAQAIAALLGDRLRFPPVLIGIGCGFPLGGWIFTGYVFDYALCGLGQPRIQAMRWYSSLSRSGWRVNAVFILAGMVVIWDALTIGFEKLTDKLPVVNLLFSLMSLICGLLIFFVMQETTQRLTQVAEERAQASIVI
jgi:hypothetical protein